MRSQPHHSSSSGAAELLRLADQCVKCGLCLPHCPTYAKLADEGDSPRGRIALIQGWASGQLVMTPTLAGHLDRCLSCRACELACPSLVAFGQLMDGAKAARVDDLPPWRRSMKLARLRLLSQPRLTLVLAQIARGYRRLGLARLAEQVRLSRLPALGPFFRLAGIMPTTARALPPIAHESPDLELFVGCMGGLAQGRAIAATRALLCEGLGLRVRIAAEPGCCGALFRHNGFPVEADARRAAWARGPKDPPLVGLASACVAELREGAPSPQALELCDFLDRLGTLHQLSLRPLRSRALVHEPCSHRNLLRDTRPVYRVLGLIPELDVQPLEGNAACCGAAGTYLLDQPAMAASLLASKLATLAEQTPDFLVTTNPGCALHLAAGIREAGLGIEVCHPVELLWRSAKGRGPSAKD